MNNSRIIALYFLIISNYWICNSYASPFISQSTNNIDLVVHSYGPFIDTWTADANLLGSLQSTFGVDLVINQIIQANNGVILDTPSIYGNGLYTLSSSDFNYGGLLGSANWWGAQAFINYLNLNAYAGSTNWQLPTIGYWLGSPGASQLSNLGYDLVTNNLYPSIIFRNFHHQAFWLGNENPVDASFGYFDYAGYLTQPVSQGKSAYLGVWAFTTGIISPIPIPSTFWLFCSAIAGFGFLKKRYE